jgi:hypothetical protein
MAKLRRDFRSMPRTPAIFRLPTANNFQEDTTMLDMEPIPFGELFAQAANRGGFTVSDVQQLLESELELDHLLDYISAVASNRMN